MKTSAYHIYCGPGRIGISRGQPRYGASGGRVPPGYRMYRALAPGPWFRSVSVLEYVRRYRHEVLDRLDPREVWEELHRLAESEEPVLLCFERAPFSRSNWCHRRIVAEWLERAIPGVAVEEIGQPPQRLADYLGFDPWGQLEGVTVAEADLFD